MRPRAIELIYGSGASLPRSSGRALRSMDVSESVSSADAITLNFCARAESADCHYWTNLLYS